ncbi:MAG: hypothetical protein JO243_07210 [Solirubrobacterales bacterium]|nr:hypothetical protein [Solirubrobacterales bacterium]
MLVLLCVAGPDEIHDGELTESVISFQGREVVVTPQHEAQDVHRLSRRQSKLERGVQTPELDGHRLSVTPVSAVSGMLGHVGIDDDTARRRVAEPKRCVGLDLAEDLPAP